MIRYKSDLFGLRTLLFWNGSAAFRAFLPALFSTGLLLVYEYALGDEYGGRNVIVHPYVITVFITFFSFLLTIRLNYSYQRYWEAATQVHQMSSKWMDSAICLASFHYQCQQYDSSRPPTFGRTPNIFNETRERERHQSQTLEDTQSLIRQVSDRQKQQGHWLWRYITPKPKETKAKTPKGRPSLVKTFKPNRTTSEQSQYLFQPPVTRLHSSERQQQPSAWKEWRAAFAAQKGKEGTKRVLKLAGLETTVPSLFLQEAAHLFSLLSAVAMATMRNDIEGAESPLADYIPGRPFPPVNPDELSQDIRRQYHESNSWLKFFYFMIGKSRSSKQRTLYNAARPFRVIGGISDKEARMLQEARGPSARMALCSIWLKEFISREYLNGSTGNVAPPIISRVYQFISDGVASYNQCRKITFIPFPFPHSQITIFFTFIALLIFPLLYFAYVNDLVFACILNFITVLCFKGIHEVARELTNPYFTVPNDLPLNHFQAEFNEALITMYAGFHPDSWKKEDKDERKTADDFIRSKEEGGQVPDLGDATSDEAK